MIRGFENVNFGGNFFFPYLSAVVRLSTDEPVVNGGGNRSARQKPPLNPKSLATFLHDPGGRKCQGNWQFCLLSGN